MQDFTLHTHTVGFDGRNTPAEMVAHAKMCGFNTLGISNHFIVHSAVRSSNLYQYAVRGGYANIYNDNFYDALNRFAAHYRELNALARICDIRLLRGLEVDFFDTPQWHRGFRHAVRALRPDYVIGATHFVCIDDKLYNVHDMANAPQPIQDKMLMQYWQNIRAAGRSGLFTWLAHLDLPRKVGLGHDARWTDVETSVIFDLAASGTRIEINTSAIKDGDVMSEPYPSLRILKQIAAHRMHVLLSDDAHDVAQIGRNFETAEKLARECGITRFARLAELVPEH